MSLSLCTSAAALPNNAEAVRRVNDFIIQDEERKLKMVDAKKGTTCEKEPREKRGDKGRW